MAEDKSVTNESRESIIKSLMDSYEINDPDIKKLNRKIAQAQYDMMGKSNNDTKKAYDDLAFSRQEKLDERKEFLESQDDASLQSLKEEAAALNKRIQEAKLEAMKTNAEFAKLYNERKAAKQEEERLVANTQDFNKMKSENTKAALAEAKMDEIIDGMVNPKKVDFAKTEPRKSVLSRSAKANLSPISSAWGKAVQKAEADPKWQEFKNSKFAQTAKGVGVGFANFTKKHWANFTSDISVAYYSIRENRAYRKEQKQIEKATAFLNEHGITTDDTGRKSVHMDLNELVKSGEKTDYVSYAHGNALEAPVEPKAVIPETSSKQAEPKQADVTPIVTEESTPETVAETYEKSLEERTTDFFAKYEALNKERNEYIASVRAEYDAKILALKQEANAKMDAKINEIEGEISKLGVEYTDVLEDQEKRLAEEEKALAEQKDAAAEVKHVEAEAKSVEEKAEQKAAATKTEQKEETKAVPATTAKKSTKKFGKKNYGSKKETVVETEKLDTPADKKKRVRSAKTADKAETALPEKVETPKAEEAKPAKEISPVMAKALLRKQKIEETQAKIAETTPVEPKAIEAKAEPAPEEAPSIPEMPVRAKKGKGKVTKIMEGIKSGLSSETGKEFLSSCAKAFTTGVNVASTLVNAKVAQQQANGYGSYTELKDVTPVDERYALSQNELGGLLPDASYTSSEPLALPAGI